MADLRDAIQSHIDKLKDSLYTSSIAEVTNVQTLAEGILAVDVVPYNARVYNTGQIVKKPTIYTVPLVFPSGGGGVLSFPIQVGDPVLLMFTKEDNDGYLAGNGSEVPKTNRKFSYNDAIAIPCVYPFQNNLQPSKDDVELKFKSSSIKIDKDGNVAVSSVGKVTIEAASEVDINVTTVNLNADVVNCTGSLNVTGDIVADGDVSTALGISLNTHIHSDVRAGTDVSGAPKI